MSGLCLTSVLLFNDLVMELGFASQPSYAELKAPLGRRWWTHSCAGAARDSAAPDGRVLESDSSVSRGSSKYLFNMCLIVCLIHRFVLCSIHRVFFSPKVLMQHSHSGLHLFASNSPVCASVGRWAKSYPSRSLLAVEAWKGYLALNICNAFVLNVLIAVFLKQLA